MKAYIHVLRYAGTTDDDGIINTVLTREETPPFRERDGHEIQTIPLTQHRASIDGNNIWEMLFSILKGDVPEAINDEVCAQLAENIGFLPDPESFKSGWNAAANRSLDERTDEEIAAFRDADLATYLEK